MVDPNNYSRPSIGGSHADGDYEAIKRAVASLAYSTDAMYPRETLLRLDAIHEFVLVGGEWTNPSCTSS